MDLHALTPEAEINRRIEKIHHAMTDAEMPAMLVTSNANIYYTTGRVINGYVYITAAGKPLYFVRRPLGIEATDVIYIHKPEQIVEKLQELGLELPDTIGMEPRAS